VSADADGTSATVPHAKSTISLYTELDVECHQQSVIVVDCRPYSPVATSADCRVVARCCQHQTARCRCLYRTRRRLVCHGEIFSSLELGTKFQREAITLILGDRPTHFPRTQRSIGRGKPVSLRKQVLKVI